MPFLAREVVFSRERPGNPLFSRSLLRVLPTDLPEFTTGTSPDIA